MKRRTRGERFGRGPRRFDQRPQIPPERATDAQAASARFVLGAADLDLLRRLWRRTGGDVIEMTDGTLAVRWPNGDILTRGDADHVTTQLRARLARRDPLVLVPA